jgi:hypothetical protein
LILPMIGLLLRLKNNLKFLLKGPCAPFRLPVESSQQEQKALEDTTMTRMYIQPSFVDSCSDHGEWSGGNGQYRGDRSVEVVPTYINGKPNVKAFSDEAIEERRPNKVAKVIPVADRILPQRRRIATLTQQMQELVADYKAGNMSIEEYSTLLSVVSAKRDRAVELLNKAVSVKAPFENVEQDSEPIKAPVKTATTTPAISSHIKQKACQVWTEARMFLVGSVAACAGLMWLAN